MYKYEEIYKFEHLYDAYRKTRRGKRNKKTTAKFEVNSLEALIYLQYLLETKQYKMNEYNVFKIYEPKERIIMSNSFKDKVVQHSICDNILRPIYEDKFIYDNYASQKGKGTHFGLDRLSENMREHYRKHGTEGWVLKCDIAKYFYSIDHDILKEKLKRDIYDKDILNLLFEIIDSVPDPGLPLGNQTSQWFALIYLNDMDNYIKRNLRVKYYGRYMDDFYIIHKDKEYVQYCLKEIEKQVAKVKLNLNNKTAIYPLKNGMDFLGFHTYLTDTGKVVRRLRRDSKTNMRRKLKTFKKKYDEGEIPLKNIILSYDSWKGHASHGNCYYLIRDMDELFDSLFKEAIEKENKERNDIEHGQNIK